MKVFTSHSLVETREIAKQWLLTLITAARTVDDYDTIKLREATVVGLSGHLGAGKTAFVKMVAKELGVKGEVTSPTFVLMKIYEINSKIQSFKDSTIPDTNHQHPINDYQLSTPNYQLPWKRLIHIDAYRLERREELEALNFEQLVADPHNLIMIEWPENIGLEKIIPNYRKIQFEVVNNEYLISY